MRYDVQDWDTRRKETCPGEVVKAYDGLCALEVEQSGLNPGCKSIYREKASEIKDACVKFTNHMAICKTHFKRVRSAAKGKAKPAQPKDEDDE